MQQQSVEMVLRELTHPAHNDQLKNQQQVTFKLVKTGERTFLITQPYPMSKKKYIDLYVLRKETYQAQNGSV